MNILTVAYFAPPDQKAQSLSCFKTLKYLARHDCHIDVVTTGKEENIKHELLDHLPQNITFHRFKQIKIPRLLLGICYKFFPFFVTIPDPQRLWIQPTLKKIHLLIKKKRPDIIYTRSQPFSDHLIGLELKKRYPNIPWIAYLSDPLVDNIYYQSGFLNLQQIINKRIEYQVFASADEIHFVSIETLDAAAKRYSESITKKFFSIPHGFDSSLYIKQSSLGDSKPIRMYHTGKFLANRNPIPIFKALIKVKNDIPNLAKKFSLTFIGSTQKRYINFIHQKELKDIVYFEERCSYLEIFKKLSNANILLVIDGNYSRSNIFFPSKLVDYIGSGIPIFGITPKHSTSDKILRELKQISVSPDNIMSIYTSLRSIIEVPPQPFKAPDKYNISTVCNTIFKRFRIAITDNGKQ